MKTATVLFQGTLPALGLLLLMTGCEYDLENGTYHAEATATLYYPDGTVETVDKSFEMSVQLAVDARGVRPDTLVFTICQDAIESLAFATCYEPIEVSAQDNNFGGEEISYADYELTDGNASYYCEQREDVVLNGTITSSTSLDFTLSYVTNIEDWGDPGCVEHYPYPTSVQMTGSAWLP